MSNYNILQLNAKELPELKDIAAELGLKVSNSVKKETLVYDILDQQAVVNAQRKTTIEKPDIEKKKRLRVPINKTTDQKVFTTANDMGVAWVVPILVVPVIASNEEIPACLFGNQVMGSAVNKTRTTTSPIPVRGRSGHAGARRH